MKLVLANPRGFCAGVYMAIDVVDQVLDICPDEPVYVYHEIVHNRHVVESFRAKGAVFVESLDEVPEGALLMFSAHGVSPAVREQAATRGMKTIDATCPLVTKVHLEARRFARDGYTIVLIGHKGHDEVVGTMGEAPGAIRLVETADDVDQLDMSPDAKVAYLTQTTLSVDDAKRIVERLRARFPELTGPPREDICYATRNRQHAVRVLAAEADLVLVVGSQNSSNSRRLKEIALQSGVPAYLIDEPESIRDAWFDAVKTVVVTAGASAPEFLVQRTINHLRERYETDVETRSFHDERTRFPLPEPLRALNHD